MSLREGSLFSGYNGLGMAVSEVFGSEPAWFSEIEAAPSKILAHHWPTVPNLGDITQIDWDNVEPVDILSGGFPCQDVSPAGKRAGLRPGTRSGLWNYMAFAVGKLRPRYVVIENVRGLLSAEAHSDVEPCPWCLGDGPGQPPLRALGAVFGDLADLGYDARGCGIRAADVGAPHGRWRFFILAADARGDGWDQGAEVLRGWESEPSTCGDTPADATDLGHERSRQSRDGWPGSADNCEPAADPDRVGLEGGQRDARPASWGRRPSDAGQPSAADPDRDGLARIGWEHPLGRDTHGRRSPNVAWGSYEPAIRRWERTLRRVAPAPTEPNSKGSQRLSPRFVEWMMGLPAGHVTAVPGVNRNAQLKALGNGVVPQQAAAALEYMAHHATGQGVSA